MTQDPGSAAFRYYAFISYSHQDKAWAGWLHKALETYVVPKPLIGRTTSAGVIPRRLTPIFRDRDELASAQDLGRKVNQALAQSANLIVICSPRSAVSRWVDEEVKSFSRLGRGERVFCLIVDGEPNASDLPGREADECFVPALRFEFDSDQRLTGQRAEPMAADARAGKDGKSNAKLKLLAGLLDIDFDALKQRELRRRAMRMTAVAALALIVMAVTSTLAVFAIVSRHAAVEASQTAQRRQKQAEGLVGFMLGDLNDKLAQVSRLDIMQSVDDKAMTYFQSLPATDVTEEALEQRAKALEKIGSVRMDQGNLSGAMESYQAALELSGRLAEETPGNATRQVAHARSWSFVGMTDWYQGNLDAAWRDFKSARDVLRQTQTRAGTDLSVTFELQSVYSNMGQVLEARGQPAAAASAYRSALVLSRELAVANPDKTNWASALGDAHNNLGKLALQRGDLAQAIAEYRADDAIEARLAADDPRNNDQRENMLRVRAILGRTLALTGDVESGIRNLQQAIDIAARLTAIAPTQTSFKEKSALYLVQLSRLKRLHGDLPAAQTLTKRALATLAVLTRQDPANVTWQRIDAEARGEQAAQSLASGETGTARRQAQGAMNILQPLLVKQPDDHGLLLDTLGARLLLADASSDAPVARLLREEAWEATQAAEGGKEDPRLIALQVEALLGLQKHEEAMPLIERLWNAGYRDPGLLVIVRRANVEYPANAAFATRIAQIMQTNAAALSPAPRAPDPRP